MIRIYLVARPGEGTASYAATVQQLCKIAAHFEWGHRLRCSISASIGWGRRLLMHPDAAAGGGAFSEKNRVFWFYQVRAPSRFSLAVARFLPWENLAAQKNPRLLPKGSFAGEIRFIYSRICSCDLIQISFWEISFWTRGRFPDKQYNLLLHRSMQRIITKMRMLLIELHLNVNRCGEFRLW